MPPIPYSLSDFDYVLPPELIAQAPLEQRTQSRLLCTDDEGLSHRVFADLVHYLRRGDLLVLNDIRVIPARLHAVKDSGGRAEVFLERVEGDHLALCQVRVSKPLKTGRYLTLLDQQGDECPIGVEVLGREADCYRLRFSEAVYAVLERFGEVPLPPYIDRAPQPQDRIRYQTVFAEQPGAVAAPTAGLHFDAGLLDKLAEKGIESTCITLHVGAGTFQPVRSEDLSQHRMHAERVCVNQESVRKIREAKARGGRVVAVGTTVVRALESAAGSGELLPFAGETRLFVTPGFQFRVVDLLITNFHLPQSSLLMLVSAFGGHTQVMAAYREAIAKRYRFFSYGDAMLLQRRTHCDPLPKDERVHKRICDSLQKKTEGLNPEQPEEA